MPGPPPKPTALRVVTGNAGKRAINTKEPKPKAERPKVPAHLDPKGKTAFKNVCDMLEQMGVLTKVDGLALELMCDAYAEWRDLRKVIDKEGSTYKTIGTSGDEVIKARPEVAMASDAWKRIRAMMSEFGMTAASRTKVQASEPEQEDPLETYRKKRK